MRIKKISLLFLTFFLSISTTLISANENYSTTNQETNLQIQGNTLNYTSGEFKARLEFCTPTMVRVRITKENDFRQNEQYMVEKYTWPDIAIKHTDQIEYIKVETGEMVVRIYKNPLRIALYDKENKNIINEDNPSDGFSINDTAVNCTKKIVNSEHFFGFGERMDYVDRLGTKVNLNVGRGQHRDSRLGAYNINAANYCPVPFFMSSKGYGLFFHTTYASMWDMGFTTPTTYRFSSEGRELDYYLIYGPEFRNILDQYTQLTGRSPLVPKVAFGLHVGTYSGGTWGYEFLTSQDYVILLAKRLRHIGIPVDMLHFDSTWRIFGEIGKGATSFEWRKPNFYNPKALVDTLKAMNFSYVGLHIRPRFDNSSFFNYLFEAQKLGYTAKEGNKPGEIIDFFNPKGVDWWWEKGLKQMADLGINFTKTDEGSVYGRRAEDSDRTGPQGESARAYHNIYPLVYAQAPYAKFSEYHKTRGYNFTREGYAGIQRYPSIFAGDWPSEWEYFLPVIRAGINTGVSGVGYWTHCMGGFERQADPELYMRWVQFGFFSPLAHVFGMDHPGYKEPWNYGRKALANFIKYDSLRYTLFPYIYSNAYEMYKTGMPLMRSLVLHYQNDTNVYKIDDQYLFGGNIMVAPVVKKDVTKRNIYLPEGEWYDFWSGTKYTGKQTIEYSCPDNVLPLLIKDGAIIPSQPLVQHLNEKVSSFTIDVFPKGNSTFNIYDDDGTTTEYMQGNFALTKIYCIEEKNKITIRICVPEGKFNVPIRTYTMKIHRSSFPKALALYKGKDKRNIYECSFNKDLGIITIPSVGTSNQTFEVVLFK